MKVNRENMEVGMVIVAGIVGIALGAYDSYCLHKAKLRAENAEYDAQLQRNLAEHWKKRVDILRDENHELKCKLATMEES